LIIALYGDIEEQEVKSHDFVSFMSKPMNMEAI